MIIFSAIFLCIIFSALECENIISVTQATGKIEFMGALNIRIHSCGDSLYPPAELLLIDPQGKMTGCQPRLKTTFCEIPNSSYENEGLDDAVSGAPGPVSKIIDVRNPLSGKYVLKIIGVESRRYSLEIRSYDHDMNFSDAKFIDIDIKKDEEHTYMINYSSRKNTETEVTPPANIKKDIWTGGKFSHEVAPDIM